MPRRLLATLAVLAGCTATPAPRYLTPPLLRVEASCFAGTPLVQRIGMAEPWPEDADQVCEVELRLHYLESMPETALGPLPEWLALVFAERDGEPVRPASTIASGSRTASGQAAADWLRNELPGARSVKMADLRAAVPAGVTGEFTATSLDAVQDSPRGPVRKHVHVRVGRARGEEGRISVALVLEDLTADPDWRGSRAEAVTPEPVVLAEADPLHEDVPDADVLYRELLLLAERPEPDGNPLVMLFPSPFTGYPGAFAVEVAVRSGTNADPEHGRRLQRCREEVAAAERELRERTRATDPADLEALAVATAWRSLAAPSTRRTALAWLAHGGNAHLAEELALVGDDRILDAWWQRLRLLATPGSRSAAGWDLERTVYAMIVETSTEAELPLAVEGALAQQAGAVGRIPAVLEDVISRSTDLQDLARELTGENLVLLRDSDPAVRVRAFDWLQARGSAPEGFDPLGPAEERRAAMAAARDRMLELGRQP